MRLTPTEIQHIKTTLAALDPAGRVWLYGSRADDARRGGDIDILFEPSANVGAIDVKTQLLIQHRLMSLTDTHVDIAFKNPALADLPLHALARKGVML